VDLLTGITSNHPDIGLISELNSDKGWQSELNSDGVRQPREPLAEVKGIVGRITQVELNLPTNRRAISGPY
jgi:hypothetical protein